MERTIIYAVSERLERLERECRLWRRAGTSVVIGGVLMLIVSGAQLSKVPNEIEAKHFVVRDERGTTRARLEVGRDGAPILRLLDSKEMPRIEMGLVDGRPSMIFYHADDKPRASLKVLPDGNPYLKLLHPDGEPRVVLSLFGAHISDLDGKACVDIGESGNRLKIRLQDDMRKTIFQVGAPEP